MLVKCAYCDKKFNKQLSQIKKSPNHYCSQRCAAIVNNRKFRKKNKKIKYCVYCNSILTKNAKKYCGSNCQHRYQHKIKINLWLAGKDRGYETNGTLRRYVKKYLLDKYGYKCSECGWDKINPNTNKCPLEIHHRDGNYKNNKEENLQILCPNCHALTDTYKNMNKGNGRECRKTDQKKSKEPKEKPIKYCVTCNKKTQNKYYCSNFCSGIAARKVMNRPKKEELINILKNNNWTAAGRMFGVSSNTIKKWARKYNINTDRKKLKAGV